MTERLNLDDSDDLFHDDPTSASATMLDTIALVDFLRRGDRYGMTLWDAIEEAIRWWTAEHQAIESGTTDQEAAEPWLGDSDPLRRTLAHLLEVTAEDDEPIHISIALQRALRRWASTARPA